MKLVRISIPNNPTPAYGLFGFIIICSGLLLCGPGLYYQWHENNTAKTPIVLPSISLPDTTQQKIKTGRPARLYLPSVNIDLTVAKGEFNQTTNTWTLSKDKAHYATVSDAPNDHYGNTFIYGHNRSQVFSHLAKLQPGAEAIINTDNNLRFVYKLANIEETDPNDTAVILPYSTKPTLSLQTCSGSWYQNRQIFRFDFVRVEES